MDLFHFLSWNALWREFWFLKMHSLATADVPQSIQLLDFNKLQEIGQCHLNHAYSLMLASLIKRNNKQF